MKEVFEVNLRSPLFATCLCQIVHSPWTKMSLDQSVPGPKFQKVKMPLAKVRCWPKWVVLNLSWAEVRLAIVKKGQAVIGHYVTVQSVLGQIMLGSKWVRAEKFYDLTCSTTEDRCPWPWPRFSKRTSGRCSLLLAVHRWSWKREHSCRRKLFCYFSSLYQENDMKLAM